MNEEQEVYPEFIIGCDVYFLFENAVQKAKLVEIRYTENSFGKTIVYEIDKNPCGDQFTKSFGDDCVFTTKQELIKSL